ncbi:hypothetical protein N7474_000058 [Penicillium riverlandense]|uniref:uncharacterized protein n=1 Tax=Penicillium riverlandense TaxID=1903569 RepID=UPI00254968A2|nr:uncharacterized protein N7474_000058 [Penicillium riverlandense]KAJ5831747.1 hypothetical protein N7474_000058 [Penicillium riverlandense]
MHAKQLLALGGLVLASNVAIAAKLEHDDVPNHCWAACGPVVGISESCNHRHDNDDSAELQCICNWGPASTQIPLCAACITQYGHNDDHDHDNDDDDNDDGDDNEALDLVHSCSFSTTTYNAAAATTLSSNSAAAATATTTGSNGSGQNSAGSSTTGSTPTTTNAAAGLSVPGVASLAAVAGMMPLALL